MGEGSYQLTYLLLIKWSEVWDSYCCRIYYLEWKPVSRYFCEEVLLVQIIVLIKEKEGIDKKNDDCADIHPLDVQISVFVYTKVVLTKLENQSLWVNIQSGFFLLPKRYSFIHVTRLTCFNSSFSESRTILRFQVKSIL